MYGNAGARSDAAYNEQVDIQYERDTAAEQFDFDQRQEMYNTLALQKVMTENNAENQALFKETAAKDEWDFEATQINNDWDATVAAYNKSEKLYGAQLGLNEIAADMAAAAAEDTHAERLDAVKFEAMEADFSLSKTKTDLTTKGAELDISQAEARSQVDQQKQQATIQHQAKRAEAAFKSEEQLVDMMKAAGSSKAKGSAGRSANKDYQAVLATGGRQQARLLDQITRADSAYNLSMMGFDKSLIYGEAKYSLGKSQLKSEGAYADLQYDLGEQQREATKLSIGAAYDRSIQQVEHDLFGANLQADAARMTHPGEFQVTKYHEYDAKGKGVAGTEVREGVWTKRMDSENGEWTGKWDLDTTQGDIKNFRLPGKPNTLPRVQLIDAAMPDRGPEVLKGAYTSAGAAQDAANTVSGIINVFSTLTSAGIACDMRVKHEVALLEYTEVDDTLSKLAFAVKELREHS